MSEYEELRVLVTQRLSAATDDICALFYAKISEYESELRRHRQLLDTLIKSDVRLHRDDVQWLSSSKREEGLSLDQVDPRKMPHIKVKLEGLGIIQETEQRQSQEEVDINMVGLGPVSPMTDNGETPESSELQQSSTEENRGDEVDPPRLLHSKEEQEGLGISKETAQRQSYEEGDINMTDEEKGTPEPSELQQSPTEENRDAEEDCAGRETARDSESDSHSGDDTEDSSDFSDHESDESDDGAPSSELRKTFSCSECGKRFSQKRKLKIHRKIHSGQKSLSCSVCSRRFVKKVRLIRHMKRHSKENEINTHKRAGGQSSQPHQSRAEEDRYMEPLENDGEEECGGSEPAHDKAAASRSESGLNSLQNNEIPSSKIKCQSGKTSVGSSECPTSSGQSQTGAAPFRCAFCGSRFHQRSALKAHMSVHSQVKWFVCSVCYEPFQSREHLAVHKRRHSEETSC